MRDNDLEPDDLALVAKLRELPPEGVEPDWQALEAAIRAEVGNQAPRPWWRNWRWIVPVWALATTAAVALLVTRGGSPQTHVAAPARIDAGVVAPAAPEHETEVVTAMWLDGEALEIDNVASAALDDIDGDARTALEPDPDVTGGILPVADYGWIDALDDESMVVAEDWLKRKKS